MNLAKSIARTTNYAIFDSLRARFKSAKNDVLQDISRTFLKCLEMVCNIEPTARFFKGVYL